MRVAAGSGALAIEESNDSSLGGVIGRLLTGRGAYIDEIDLPGQARGYVLRAPVANGAVRRVDTGSARAMPGVLAVLTGLLFARQVAPAMAEAGAARPQARPKIELDAGAQLRMVVVIGVASLFGGIVFLESVSHWEDRVRKAFAATAEDMMTPDPITTMCPGMSAMS